jgi:hypothetical protein
MNMVHACLPTKAWMSSGVRREKNEETGRRERERERERERKGKGKNAVYERKEKEEEEEEEEEEEKEKEEEENDEGKIGRGVHVTLETTDEGAYVHLEGRKFSISQDIINIGDKVVWLIATECGLPHHCIWIVFPNSFRRKVCEYATEPLLAWSIAVEELVRVSKLGMVKLVTSENGNKYADKLRAREYVVYAHMRRRDNSSVWDPI